MRKSLIVVLAALGGGASSAAGVVVEPVKDDPAIWRWHVSNILDSQVSADAAKLAESQSQRKFEQRYVRYSTLGQPERRR